MLKYYKLLSLIVFFFTVSESLLAQECNLKISGFIKDRTTRSPVSYTTIFLQESSRTAVSDSLGFFKIPDNCSGVKHLTTSFIGAEQQEVLLNLLSDTLITIYLDVDRKYLEEASVIAENNVLTTQENQSLNAEDISGNSNENLASMLESISGVSAIKNGSGIAKPIIQGLYGNRISILNNSVAQSGQQWGVDHSPEIDPLVANRITVVKGVGALEYQGSSLGSIILVEPKLIERQKSLKGTARYIFESNGLGNGANLEFQQFKNKIGWMLTGTLKKSGDLHTPSYFLANTGTENANMAFKAEGLWNKKWKSQVYVSSFNAKLGVLRGSHIGNLTDLETALSRDLPFFTSEQFSYAIRSPYQKVKHNLAKFSTNYAITESQSIDFTYAVQHNIRKEFDVRRSGRSDMPALSLKQVSNFLEAKYQNDLPSKWKLKSGFQFNKVDNVNLPETGILPLIPDYISGEYGVFGTVLKRFEKTTVELGGRYDYEIRNVAAISMTLPREVIRYRNEYQNVGVTGGISRNFGKSLKAAFNSGYVSRNPEVNELYSNGLHQGVSGIEEGNPNLGTETSLKQTLSLSGRISEKLNFESAVFYQSIDNYIFLNPQNEFRLTIRGAFPVFKYEATNAQLVGADLMVKYQASERLSLKGNYSYLNGKDLTHDVPLIYMPPSNFYGTIDYKIPKLGKLCNVLFELNAQVVAEQKNLLVSQDFVLPPESYSLIGLKMSAEKRLNKVGLSMFLKFENLLNETYRDYLNRQRYFADDLGFNAVAGLSVSF